MENFKKENQKNLKDQSMIYSNMDINCNEDIRNFDFEKISNFDFKKINRRNSIENFYSFDNGNCFQNQNKNFDENEILIFDNFCNFNNNNDNEKNDTGLDNYYLMSNHSPENSKSNNSLLNKKRNKLDIYNKNIKVNFIK
jgi:hypothetical protein